MPSGEYRKAMERKVKAEKREKRDGTCRECGGTGKILRQEAYYDEESDYWNDEVWETCPRCHGSGKVR